MLKTVLITGGSGGIGKEIAKILYRKNYNLVLVAKDIKSLESVKNELEKEKKNAKIYIYSADLRFKESCKKIYDFTTNQGIHIDILINNAGIGTHEGITNTKENDIYNILMVNSYSLTNLTAMYAEEMKKRKSGYILNIASLAAYQPVPYIATYAASKAYVLNFSEAIFMELKEHGIHVCCFSPGHTKTNFFDRAKISNSHHFYGAHTRSCPKKVASKAIKVLFKKKISSVYGIKNYITSLLNRFVSRRMTALISYNLVNKRENNNE